MLQEYVSQAAIATNEQGVEAILLLSYIRINRKYSKIPLYVNGTMNTSCCEYIPMREIAIYVQGTTNTNYFQSEIAMTHMRSSENLKL